MPLSVMRCRKLSWGARPVIAGVDRLGIDRDSVNSQQSLSEPVLRKLSPYAVYCHMLNDRSQLIKDMLLKRSNNVLRI